MKSIQTANAPAAVGPYSQAIVIDQLIFCSGQIGLDPATGELQEGIEQQLHQIIKNISAVLHAAGSDLNHVVKTTLFIANMQEYITVNTVYGHYFSDHKPARSTVGVLQLPKNALVEMEVIARIK